MALNFVKVDPCHSLLEKVLSGANHRYCKLNIHEMIEFAMSFHGFKLHTVG